MSWRANVSIVGICLVVVGLVSTRWVEDFRGVTGNVLAAGLVALIEAVIVNWRQLRLWISALRLGQELVRVSVSYLIRIKVDDRFLLVRGHRITTQFQPVGGAYKYYPSALGELQKVGALDDDKVPLDDTSRHDLRLRIPGRRLPEFLHWFESEKGREIGAWREFHEELIDSGILPASAFPYASFEFVRRHYTRIQLSAHFSCRELLVADIFDLCPGPEQAAALSGIQGPSDEFRWVTEAEIRSLGVVPPNRLQADISPTAMWIV